MTACHGLCLCYVYVYCEGHCCPTLTLHNMHYCPPHGQFHKIMWLHTSPNIMWIYIFPTFSTGFPGFDRPACFVASVLVCLDGPVGFGVSVFPGFDNPAGLGVFDGAFVMLPGFVLRRTVPTDPPGVSKASCTSNSSLLLQFATTCTLHIALLYAHHRCYWPISTHVINFMLTRLLAITEYDIHAHYNFRALHFTIITRTRTTYTVITNTPCSIATTELQQTLQCS